MSMLDDMVKLASLQQMTGGGQQGQMSPQDSQMPNHETIPQGNYNPIANGSEMALQAVKRSLQMSDSENQRALGRGMLGMMASIYNNPHHGHGVGGNIAATASGLLPFLQHYDTERNRIANINFAILAQQKEDEKLARQEAREMKRLNQQMEIAQKKLAIDQGYFGLKKQEMENERKIAEEMSKAGAHIPMHTLSPMQHTKAMADIKSYIEKGDASIPALQAIDTIEHILGNDQDVTKHWGTIVLAAQRNDPSIIRQQLANRVPDKTRMNAEMLSKSLSVLATSKFKGVPARGLTVFAEKMLKEGSPSMDMHGKSILKMIKPDKKFFSHNIEARDEVYDNLEKGIYYIPKPMKLELEKWEDEEPGNDNSSREAKIKELQMLEEMLKMAPE